MEFLKDLFGGQALSYEQLAAAAKDKGLAVVDASGGAYAPRSELENLSAQVDMLTRQLGEANEKLEGFDPEWKTKAEAARKELDARAFDFALEKALGQAKAKNITAVKALLDREKLSFSGNEVIGLEPQIRALQGQEDAAFLFEQDTPVKTGMSHQGGGESRPDRKDQANAALRALLGKEN